MGSEMCIRDRDNPADVQLAVDRGIVGQSMPITVERNGVEQVLEVQPQEMTRKR